jgi:hypothetical protein
MATCITCGFLAKRPEFMDTPERGYFEVEAREREDVSRAAYINFMSGGILRTVVVSLACFRQASVFPSEKCENARLLSGREEVRQALEEHRECALWRKYDAGQNPRDHLQEQRIYLLEQERNAFQAALSNQGWWIGVAALLLALLQMLTISSDALILRLPSYLKRLISN